MRPKARFASALLGMAVLFFVTPSRGLCGAEPYRPSAASVAEAGRVVAAMSDEAALSQLLFVGYPGERAPTALVAWIRARGLGGVKIFGWSGRDTARLASSIATLQAAALDSRNALPILVATDQEGGWIRHVKGRSSESPGNMAIGATGLDSDAYRSGRYIGRELRTLGITLNFAPVVDIATRPDSSIIGPRAFSDDPQTVARLGAAWAKGLADAGVMATAKHFPGHGATPFDSHGRLPLIDAPRELLDRRELLPFRRLIDEGVPVVMSGHLAVPALSGGMGAVSASRAVMTDLLRGELRFEGVAVTDDMYMNGLSGARDIADACVKAILAGNDMVVLSTAPEEDGMVWKTLRAALDSDAAFARRVRESARRVVALKLDRLSPLGRAVLVPDAGRAEGGLPEPGAAEFFADLARRSATLLRGAGALPFAPDRKPIVAGPFQSFLDAGKASWPGARSFRTVYLATAEERKASLEAFTRELGEARRAGTTDAVLCVAEAAAMEYARAARDAGMRVALVSALSPVFVRGADWAAAIVAVYSHAAPSLRAGVEALAGRFMPAGRLPLSSDLP